MTIVVLAAAAVTSFIAVKAAILLRISCFSFQHPLLGPPRPPCTTVMRQR
jgi:hypothetical protein